MPHNNIEVEMKFLVDKDLFTRIEEELAKTAEFKGEVREIDTYYNSPHRDFLAPYHPVEYLRVREKQGQGIFAYKYVNMIEGEAMTHADEFEVKVDDPAKLKRILEVLDFKSFIIIDKVRKKYDYKGDFEISLDMVCDLGYFIEIENEKSSGSIDETNAAIAKVAESLGINMNQRNNEGYVLAMMKKQSLR